jgi:hypothetical protein
LVAVKRRSDSIGLRSLEVRRQERELFFRTARQWLKLALFAAVVLYSIASLASGHVPIYEDVFRRL